MEEPRAGSIVLSVSQLLRRLEELLPADKLAKLRTAVRPFSCLRSLSRGERSRLASLFVAAAPHSVWASVCAAEAPADVRVQNTARAVRGWAARREIQSSRRAGAVAAARRLATDKAAGRAAAAFARAPQRDYDAELRCLDPACTCGEAAAEHGAGSGDEEHRPCVPAPTPGREYLFAVHASQLRHASRLLVSRPEASCARDVLAAAGRLARTRPRLAAMLRASVHGASAHIRTDDIFPAVEDLLALSRAWGLKSSLWAEIPGAEDAAAAALAAAEAEAAAAGAPPPRHFASDPRCLDPRHSDGPLRCGCLPPPRAWEPEFSRLRFCSVVKKAAAAQLQATHEWASARDRLRAAADLQLRSESPAVALRCEHVAFPMPLAPYTKADACALFRVRSHAGRFARCRCHKYCIDEFSCSPTIPPHHRCGASARR